MKLFLPFFPLIKPPIRCFKLRDLQFFGKQKSFFLDHWPIYRYILVSPNRALLISSYWEPPNFLVLGALSSSSWKQSSLFLSQAEMELSATSLFVMSFSMCDRISHFSFKLFVFSLRLTEIFVLTTLKTRNRYFFIYSRNFCFDSNSNLFGNSKMKFEYVNVRDRERKWFKGLENLFNNREKFEIEKFEIEKGYLVFLG